MLEPVSLARSSPSLRRAPAEHWSIGEPYIVTAPKPVAWEQYHVDVAAALGATGKLVFAPADLLLRAFAHYGGERREGLTCV